MLWLLFYCRCCCCRCCCCTHDQWLPICRYRRWRNFGKQTEKNTVFSCRFPKTTKFRKVKIAHALEKITTTTVPKPNPQARQKRKTFSYLRDSDSKAIFLKICTQMSKRFYVGETFPSKRIFSRKNVIQICLALITLTPTQNLPKKKSQKTQDNRTAH